MDRRPPVLYPLFQHSRIPGKLRKRLYENVGEVLKELGSCALADLKMQEPHLLNIAYEWSKEKVSRQTTIISMCLAYIESLDFEAAKTIVGKSQCFEECDYIRDLLAGDLHIYSSKPVPTVILESIDKQLYTQQIKTEGGEAQSAQITYGQLALEDAEQRSPHRLMQTYATDGTVATINLINAYMALTYRTDLVAEHAYKALLTFRLRNAHEINPFIHQYLAHITLFIPGYERGVTFVSDYHHIIQVILESGRALWERDPKVRQAEEYREWSQFTDHLVRKVYLQKNTRNSGIAEEMNRVSAILSDYYPSS